MKLRKWASPGDPENVVKMGSISVNPHFTIHCSNVRTAISLSMSSSLNLLLWYEAESAIDDNVQSEFVIFFFTIFACLPPLGSAARCGPHPPHPPGYATADADTGEQVGCVYLGWSDVQLHNIAAVRIARRCRDWPQSSSVVSDAVRMETVNQSLSSNRASGDSRF